MLDTIVLITKYYPYNIGRAPAEFFLENEIFILAQNAECIYIFALDAKCNDRITTKLPENVFVFPGFKCNINKYIGTLCWSIKEIIKPMPEVSFERKQIFGLKRKLYLSYFAGKSDCYIKNIKLLFRKIQLIQGDKCVIYNFWFYTYARVAVHIKQQYFTGAFICSRAHGYDLYEYRNSMNYLPLRTWLLSNMTHVFPCSKDGSNYLKKKYQEHTDKIKTSYLGSPDYGVQRCDVENNSFVIVSCSRLIRVKRIDLLIDALGWLETKYPEILFTWKHLGGGEEYEALKTRMNMKLHHNKVELAGTMPNKEVLLYYKNNCVDLFVNVSESEGLPISIMEACSFGIPILATDVGGTKEIVKDGVSGWLISKDIKAEELGKKIHDIMQMSIEEKEMIRKNARKEWKVKFQINKNTQEMLQLMENHINIHLKG